MSTETEMFEEAQKNESFAAWCRTHPDKGFADLLAERNALLAAALTVNRIIGEKVPSRGSIAWRVAFNKLRAAIKAAEEPQ
jgi:hypothetical protein